MTSKKPFLFTIIDALPFLYSVVIELVFVVWTPQNTKCPASNSKEENWGLEFASLWLVTDVVGLQLVFGNRSDILRVCVWILVC